MARVKWEESKIIPKVVNTDGSAAISVKQTKVYGGEVIGCVRDRNDKTVLVVACDDGKVREVTTGRVEAYNIEEIK